MENNTKRVRRSKPNIDDTSIINKGEDVLINKIKALSEKYEISFTEALEIVKYFENKTEENLRSIISSLGSVEKSVHDAGKSICREIGNLSNN